MGITDSEKFMYYVYEHIIDGKVFYVGKGKGGRAQDKKSRSYYWRAFVGERANEVNVVIKGQFIEEVDAFMFEFLLINKYVDEGFLLVNMIYNDKALEVANTFGEEVSELLREDARKRFDIIRMREEKFKGRMKFLNEASELRKIVLRDVYLNRNLKIEDKRVICEELNLTDERGRLKYWPTVSKYIEHSGYIIEDKVKMVDKKRARVSIITIKG